MSIKKSTYQIIDYGEWLKQAPRSFKKFYKDEITVYNKFIRRNQIILDVGFGSGRLLKKLKLKKGCKLVGIEKDNFMYEKYAPKFQYIPNTFLLFNDITKSCFYQNTFDIIIIAGNTFSNFIKKKKVVIKEVRRILKPKGIFLFSVYNEHSVPFRMKAYERDPLQHRVLSNGTIQGIHRGKVVLTSEQFNKLEIKKLFKSLGATIKIVKELQFCYIIKVMFK